MSDDDTTDNSRYSKILQEAKERFKRCEEWEGSAIQRGRDDLRFVLGDPDNRWQWEEGIARQRESDRKPTLTINKTRVHCLQIINDIRQNKPSIVVKPTGGNATYDAAEIFEGVCRYVEYRSQAKNTYVKASASCVYSGIGYWRVTTDYIDDTSFDQEIFIRPVKNMDHVYIDPDISEPDGSDAEFAFLFEDVSLEQFQRQYPDFDGAPKNTILGEAESYLGEKMVRVAEYYVKEYEDDELVYVINPNDGKPLETLKSQQPPEFIKEWRKLDSFKSRPVQHVKIRWYKIAGDKIIDEEDWAGKYIPIVRVVADENIIDGRLERKGHVRALKDAQRMYNYNSSAAIETVAGQTKSPWVADARAVEGNEQAWASANVSTPSVLIFNGIDENGNPVPEPKRLDPPKSSEAYLHGMEVAQQEMMMASGQYQSQFGQNENATSGKAISERQRQGDNATYHFIDAQAMAVRYTGRILIDLIPKIYDTERVIKIMAEDGTESDVTINPDLNQAHEKLGIDDNKEEQIIFNPQVGQYDVQADIGPDYSTKRQEAFNALTQIIMGNPALVNVAGDLLMRAADFPMADKLAERLERMVPQSAKEDGLPPDVQQQIAAGMQQIQNLQANVNSLVQQLAEEKAKNRDKRGDLQIDAYRAESERLRDFSNMPPEIPLPMIQQIIQQTIAQMRGENLGSAAGISQPQGRVPMRPMGMPQRQMPMQRPAFGNRPQQFGG